MGKEEGLRIRWTLGVDFGVVAVASGNTDSLSILEVLSRMR